ncbi:MAG: hypothetical protein RLZZ156_2758 [Deinococcota bacterium]|jgi:hypothetical protein
MQIRSQKNTLVRFGGQILVSVAVVFAFNFFQHNQLNVNNRGFTTTELNGKTPAFNFVGNCEKPGSC